MKAKKTIVFQLPDKLDECLVSSVMVQVPIEDHPNFSKPDIRFRNHRTRKIYREMKDKGIVTFLVPAWEITRSPS